MLETSFILLISNNLMFERQTGLEPAALSLGS